MNTTQNCHISVILTCHNRREKTLACLNALFQALDKLEDKPKLLVFLTDDGCTDDTANAVSQSFPQHDIRITRSEDDLFWARGMNLSWRRALQECPETDYFLLLNDDTQLNSDGLRTLLATYERLSSQVQGELLLSGLTVSALDGHVTYGGKRWRRRWLGINEIVVPKGEPMPVDETNANILLVPREIVRRLGIFCDDYNHSSADFDYSLMAAREGFPAFVTGVPCGTCERDHPDQWGKQHRIMNMTLSERKAYYRNPLTSMHDHLLFVRRNTPFRLPLVLLGRWMNIYVPRLYNRLFGFRY